MQRADRRKYHYIYKITRDDGRFYIGMHSTDNLDDGYFGSGKLITRSVKRHGLAKHAKEILEFCQSRDELKVRETTLITDEMRSDKLCMNLAPGGGGGFATKEQQRKATLSGNRSAKRDHNASTTKATKTKRARGTMFIPPPNTFGMLGKTHSVETKLLQSKSHTAENNSQYGTCWVTNGLKALKIKNNLIDEYLSNGFVRGRKLHH